MVRVDEAAMNLARPIYWPGSTTVKGATAGRDACSPFRTLHASWSKCWILHRLHQTAFPGKIGRELPSGCNWKAWSWHQSMKGGVVTLRRWESMAQDYPA